MSAWLEGEVVENRHWTDALFSLRVKGAPLAFESGQFVRIALDIGGERVARAFSMVNAPGEPLLEFYGIVVPEGPLSPRLARLEAGARLFVASNPAGFLVLSELPDAETLWLMATGTGIAPFVSMLRAETPWQRFENVVLVHAVRHAHELVYRDDVERARLKHAARFRYVPIVSREDAAPALRGRIPALLRDARLEAAAGLKLARADSQVMLCGNPDMLKDTNAALAERGLRKNRRRSPGQITVESFW
ncbi:MAG TPA: ferredoxin--NADP reductase [Burkholderiales bacterium]|jgi:ferredoxin--NADP+ reductase